MGAESSENGNTREKQGRERGREREREGGRETEREGERGLGMIGGRSEASEKRLKVPVHYF